MRNLLYCLFLLLSSSAMSQDSTGISKLTLGDQLSGEIKGDMSKGTKMDDLSWAWSSANACFPETQKRKFTGNHVLYQIDLPTRSEMEITVIPDDKNADFSIYAYQTGLENAKIVPNLPSCIRCEADHKWDYKKRGKVQDHTRTVSNLVATVSPYTVIIGVTGANGLAEGGYTLRITLRK